jgi:nitrogen fixation protein NifU and related proteins
MNDKMDLFDEVEGLVLEDAAKIFSPKVIEHFRNPQNYGQMEEADGYTYMSGICGDTIGIYVGLADGKIDRISFVTDGCGPTIACSSALTCLAKGLKVAEAMKLTGPDLIAYLGGLPIENTHCADLAVNTLRGALEKVS